MVGIMVDINTSRLSTPVAAFVGLLSVAAGFGVGQLVGGFVSPSSSPFLAVDGTAVDFIPIWLKDFAVRTFGSDDKLVLLSGMAVVIGLVGVTTGLLSRRSQQTWLGSPTAVLTDPGRQARDRNEPRAAADRARLPRPNDRPRSLWFRVRHQINHRYGARHVRYEACLLLAARLGPTGPDQDDIRPAHSGESARTHRSQVSHGRIPRASTRSRYTSTTASGSPRSCPRKSIYRHLADVPAAGTVGTRPS
jgi:hypothetical protein